MAYANSVKIILNYISEDKKFKSICFFTFIMAIMEFLKPQVNRKTEIKYKRYLIILIHLLMKVLDCEKLN